MTMRLLAALLALSCLVPTGSGAAPRVEPYIWADANWFIPTDNPKRLTWFFASAWGPNDLGPEEIASIGKGWCRLKRNGTGSYLACGAPLLGIGDGADVFQMDPAMQTAEMRIEGKDGEAHTVSWMADPDAWAGPTPEVCEAGARIFTYLHRPGTATGTIGGHRLPVDDPDAYQWTGLTRTLSVRACAGELGRRAGGWVYRTFELGDLSRLPRS